ncbi:MAG TPA: RluA family pseudouridine synthase [Oscillospiraceae bacterium]|nr:RluA family pseudouridine synthase [Oscillospiraceae bacterium]
MRQLTFQVSQEFDGTAVKSFLRNHCGLSARLLVKLKRQPNGLTANGVLIRTIDILHSGDIICITMPDDSKQLEPKSLPIHISYEDEDVLVVDKPHDMPMYPSPGHDCDSLANAVAAYFLNNKEKLAFRPVYRLDKDTSGLIIIAKNAYAAAKLATTVKKEYTAICEGILSGSGTIDFPIQIKEGYGIQREVGQNGIRAVTHWQAVSSGNHHTLLKLHLETGRTHQIRVHLSHIGHPLAGDDMYGGSRKLLDRQALHCSQVSFIHPVTAKQISLVCELPRDMETLALACDFANCTKHIVN